MNLVVVGHESSHKTPLTLSELATRRKQITECPNITIKHNQNLVLWVEKALNDKILRLFFPGNVELEPEPRCESRLSQRSLRNGSSLNLSLMFI